MSSKKFFYIGDRMFYFFESEAGVVAWFLKPLFGFSPIELWIICQKNKCRFYMREDDEYPFSQVMNKLLKKPDLYQKIFLDFRRHRQKFTKELSNLRQERLKKITSEELWFWYKKLRDFYIHFQQLNSILRRLDFIGTPFLRKLLLVNKPSDVDKFLSVLTATEHESHHTEEEREFLELVIFQIKNGYASLDSSPDIHRGRNDNLMCFVSQSFREIIKSHLKKYGWVGRSYYNEKGLTSAMLQKRMKEIMKNPFEAQNRLQFLKENPQKIKKERIKYLKDIKAKRQEIIILSKILREFSYLKDYIRGGLAEIFYHFDKVYQEIALKINLTAHEVRSLTGKEMKECLVNKKIISRQLLKKRQAHYLVRPKGRAVEIFYGKRAMQIENEYLPLHQIFGSGGLSPKTLSKESEYQGRSCYPGRVRGTVYVLKSVQEIKKVKNGQILVVNNTSPSLVPYLKKVGAIIAEEGGVTTHVSIITRELKIPCVVGISGITQILKNEEKVEVDAERGIVRRLT